MMSLPLCEFHSSQVMRNKKKKILKGTLIIIYNYSNEPSIAHLDWHQSTKYIQLHL